VHEDVHAASIGHQPPRQGSDVRIRRDTWGVPHILAKTDGCGKMGMPDANDWIVDCMVQAELSFDINRIIMAVSALI